MCARNGFYTVFGGQLCSRDPLTNIYLLLIEREGRTGGLLTVSMETVRMAKSRLRKTQPKRSYFTQDYFAIYTVEIRVMIS